jgi:hypothetical protein
MAAFLERSINGGSYHPPSGTGLVFDDVSSSYWAVDCIEQLFKDGITTGCNTNPPRYCPDLAVTRAEMAAFLLRAKYVSWYSPPGIGSSSGFYDVTTDYWAAAWIKQLASEGITQGCGDNLFCPENFVTRAEMATFLARTFDLIPFEPTPEPTADPTQQPTQEPT